MIYLLDPVTLQAELAGMGNEQRGLYILTETLNLIAGKETSWAKKQPKPRTIKELGGYSETFEMFWKAYPQHRRTAKGDAYAAWKKADKMYTEKHLISFLGAVLEALAWQTKQPDWTKDKGQYVPLPATYLNKRRWEDSMPIGMTKEAEKYLDYNGVWRTRGE
jgi:hypothetical protein